MTCSCKSIGHRKLQWELRGNRIFSAPFAQIDCSVLLSAGSERVPERATLYISLGIRSLTIQFWTTEQSYNINMSGRGKGGKVVK